MAETQNFENHAKFVPAYHIVALGIFVINFFWRVYQVIHAPSADAGISLLLSIGLLLLFFFARIFALTVQDRVIRLEMRLRMQQVLPADLRAAHGRILGRAVGIAALRQRRGIAGTVPESAGREDRGPQDHQKNGEKLAAGFSAGVKGGKFR